MLTRTFGSLVLALVIGSTTAQAQASKQKSAEPVADGRTLSEWVVDLTARAPQVRNAAAYELAGMGPAAAPAVPALIKALDDSEPSVRFPVTVALGEIGPAAAASVPRLKQMMEEEINDEIAAGARRAIRKIKPEALGSDSP
jgi:HEAT repeat protein